MNNVISDFKSKVEEIDEYFSFVKTTTYLNREFDKTKTIKISENVQNILKANLFLLLYNLIESSFKNSLEKICVQITDDKLEYKNVISEIKNLWIEKEYKNFENLQIPKGIKKSEFIMNKIDNIAKDIIEIKFYKDDKKRKNDDISGNLDAREINKINEKYGAKLIDKPNIDTQSLLTVKTQRNDLAHGDKTFTKCGANYTISELEIIKNESIDYMRFILTHIKTFIDEKKYKKERE